jgi:hypothetical protein
LPTIVVQFLLATTKTRGRQRQGKRGLRVNDEVDTQRFGVELDRGVFDGRTNPVTLGGFVSVVQFAEQIVVRQISACCGAATTTPAARTMRRQRDGESFQPRGRGA